MGLSKVRRQWWTTRKASCTHCLIIRSQACTNISFFMAESKLKTVPYHFFFAIFLSSLLNNRLSISCLKCWRLEGSAWWKIVLRSVLYKVVAENVSRYELFPATHSTPFPGIKGMTFITVPLSLLLNFFSLLFTVLAHCVFTIVANYARRNKITLLQNSSSSQANSIDRARSVDITDILCFFIVCHKFQISCQRLSPAWAMFYDVILCGGRGSYGTCNALNISSSCE